MVKRNPEPFFFKKHVTLDPSANDRRLKVSLSSALVLLEASEKNWVQISQT